MDMSEKDFLYISPRAFHNKLQGFNQLRQNEYELVRLQTVELLNIWIDSKKRIQPWELWRFSWDKKPEGVIQDTDKAKRIAEKMGRIEKRHG